MATMPRQGRMLRRSRTNRIFGGVCAGLATYFSVDPLLVRLVFIGLTFLDGAGLLIYVLMWLLVPTEDSTSAPAATGQGG